MRYIIIHHKQLDREIRWAELCHTRSEVRRKMRRESRDARRPDAPAVPEEPLAPGMFRTARREKSRQMAAAHRATAPILGADDPPAQPDYGEGSQEHDDDLGEGNDDGFEGPVEETTRAESEFDWT